MSSNQEHVLYTGLEELRGDSGTPNTTVKTVVVKDGVTHIPDDAFLYCTHLSSIVIPSSVKQIGKRAFQGCKSLRAIPIQSSVVSIGSAAFSGCESLSSIEMLGLKSIPENLLSYCSSLSSVTFGNNIRQIGKYAFYKCTSLHFLKLPKSIVSIEDWSFYECSSLISVVFPSSLEKIGTHAFMGCSSLSAIVLPAKTAFLGEQCFRDCATLSFVALPASIKKIEQNTFKECPGLEQLLAVTSTPFINATNLPDALNSRRSRIAFELGDSRGGGGVRVRKDLNMLLSAYGVSIVFGPSDVVKALEEICEKSKMFHSNSQIRETLEENASKSKNTRAIAAIADMGLRALIDDETMKNSSAFRPPQQQPCALRLKKIGQVLLENMFPSNRKSKKMDVHIRRVIQDHYIPIARDHFAECVDQSKNLVSIMKKEYQQVREGHLRIYADTLCQIRQEPVFPELQRRSEKLVSHCVEIQRKTLQESNTVCDLYERGELVSHRYEQLMEDVASKTGAIFHAAPRKGLLRISEKLALTPEPCNWEPARVCDLVRGAIECNNFTTMLNVLRLLCDLDVDERLSVAGETGGISEKIVITRSKGRFGKPTSGNQYSPFLSLASISKLFFYLKVGGQT